MKTSFVYFVQAGMDGLVKIGRSTNVQSRLTKMQTDSSTPLTLLAVMPGDEDTERRIHQEVAAHRARGEWFFPHAEVLSVIERERAAYGVILLRQSRLRVPRNKLQAWRWSRGLSLRALGSKLGIGCSSLSQIETGRRQPGWKVMIALVRLSDGAVMPNDFIPASRIPQKEAAA